MIDNPATAVPAASTVVVTDRQSYADWPSIFTGAAVASAVSVVMLGFGAALGLSLVSADPGEGVAARWAMIAGGLWFVWVAVSSFAAGGYVAGRMRRRADDSGAEEREIRDGINGLAVWGLGVLVAAVLAAGGTVGMLGALGSAVGTAAQTATTAADGMADDALAYRVSVLLRPEAGVVRPGGVDDGNAAETTAILGRVLADGEIEPADRAYLAERVAVATGADEATAEARVDQAVTDVQAAREAAIEAVERARVTGLVAAFIVAATLAVGAAAAYFAAVTGAKHRDQGIFIGD